MGAVGKDDREATVAGAEDVAVADFGGDFPWSPREEGNSLENIGYACYEACWPRQLSRS